MSRVRAPFFAPYCRNHKRSRIYGFFCYEEQIAHKLGGRKWFYAHSYYSEDEFWNIYDKKWYNKLRQKYHATTLPDIYARVRVQDRTRSTLDEQRSKRYSDAPNYALPIRESDALRH